MISHFVWQPKPQFQMSTNLSVRHRDEYRIPQHLMSVKVNDSMVIMYDGKRSGWLICSILTYFQPRVVLQHSQKMSATAWRPVSSTLSSAGPQPMFTLKTYKIHTFIKQCTSYFVVHCILKESQYNFCWACNILLLPFLTRVLITVIPCTFLLFFIPAGKLNKVTEERGVVVYFKYFLYFLWLCKIVWFCLFVIVKYGKVFIWGFISIFCLIRFG